MVSLLYGVFVLCFSRMFLNVVFEWSFVWCLCMVCSYGVFCMFFCMVYVCVLFLCVVCLRCGLGRCFFMAYFEWCVRLVCVHVLGGMVICSFVLYVVFCMVFCLFLVWCFCMKLLYAVFLCIVVFV